MSSAVLRDRERMAVAAPPPAQYANLDVCRY
jgi:hypothetical protein